MSFRARARNLGLSQAEVRRLEALVAQARANATRSENEAGRGERLRASNAISAELADSRTSAAQFGRPVWNRKSN